MKADIQELHSPGLWYMIIWSDLHLYPIWKLTLVWKRIKSTSAWLVINLLNGGIFWKYTWEFTQVNALMCVWYVTRSLLEGAVCITTWKRIQMRPHTRVPSAVNRLSGKIAWLLTSEHTQGNAPMIALCVINHIVRVWKSYRDVLFF